MRPKKAQRSAVKRLPSSASAAYRSPKDCASPSPSLSSGSLALLRAFCNLRQVTCPNRATTIPSLPNARFGNELRETLLVIL